MSNRIVYRNVNRCPRDLDLLAPAKPSWRLPWGDPDRPVLWSYHEDQARWNRPFRLVAPSGSAQRWFSPWELPDVGVVLLSEVDWARVRELVTS